MYSFLDLKFVVQYIEDANDFFILIQKSTNDRGSISFRSKENLL